MPRYCLLGHVNPARLGEYREVHRQVWPELLEALRDAGRRNYSLFLRKDGTLIGYAEADDLDAAQAQVAQTEVDRRWQAQAAELFGGDGPPNEAWELVPEVFHLETQLAAAAADRSKAWCAGRWPPVTALDRCDRPRPRAASRAHREVRGTSWRGECAASVPRRRRTSRARPGSLATARAPAQPRVLLSSAGMPIEDISPRRTLQHEGHGEGLAEGAAARDPRSPGDRSVS